MWKLALLLFLLLVAVASITALRWRCREHFIPLIPEGGMPPLVMTDTIAVVSGGYPVVTGGNTTSPPATTSAPAATTSAPATTTTTLAPTTTATPTRTPTPTGTTIPSTVQKKVSVPKNPTQDNEFSVKADNEGVYRIHYGSTPLRIMGVNVMGFEYANPKSVRPDFIDTPYTGTDAISTTVAKIKELGFNLVRVPFAFEIVDAATHRAKLAAFVKECCKKNILVMFDCHRILQEGKQMYFNLDADGTNVITYNNKSVTREEFESMWVNFLTDFKNYPNVIGADLFNEPHGKVTWGDNGDYDWKRDAETIGKNICDTFKGKFLIFVEGIETYGTETGQWGSMLMGVKESPIDLGEAYNHKIVYAPTVYGPDLYGHEYPKKKTTQQDPNYNYDTDIANRKGSSQYKAFHAGNFPLNLPDLWDKHWGFILKEKIGAVLIKEWGGHMGFRHTKRNLKADYPQATDAALQAEADRDAIWADALVKYINEKKLDSVFWVFYNPGGEGDDVGAVVEKNSGVISNSRARVPGAGGTFTETDKITVIKKGYGNSEPLAATLQSCPS